MLLQVNGQDVSLAGHTAVVAAITEGSAVARRPTIDVMEKDLYDSSDDEACTTPVRRNTGFSSSWEDDIYSPSRKRNPHSSPLLRRKRFQTRLDSMSGDRPNSVLYTDFRNLELLGGLQGSPLADGSKPKSLVSITVGIGGLDHNTRYAYESAGGSRIFVREIMSESKYCFSVPIEVCPV